ncbi:MAG: hypothetical protein HY290_00030 [Planctomycetia bacterium]|nr:hypothetical protein [Planctomycetia bacterium]
MARHACAQFNCAADHFTLAENKSPRAAPVRKRCASSAYRDEQLTERAKIGETLMAKCQGELAELEQELGVLLLGEALLHQQALVPMDCRRRLSRNHSTKQLNPQITQILAD